MIRLIAGLGNPGTAYELTRHNIGQRILRAVGEQNAVSWRLWRGHHWAEWAQAPADRESRILLFWSEDFMNRSGPPLAAFAAYRNIAPSEILVIHDDLDMSLGRIQVKLGGGAGGHHGVESVIEALGTDQWWRLRIGIGRPEETDYDDRVGRRSELISAFVLQPFTKEEMVVVTSVVDATTAFLIEFVQHEPKSITKTITNS